MRTTHLELFKSILGTRFDYLEQYYNQIKALDKDDKYPLAETIFDYIFSPEICCTLFGTPNLDRTTRLQRKMDLAVLREIYHLWRDKNYFDLSPNLCSMLIDADLKDIDTFFLRTPYRSMYISLPKGNGLKIPNPQSGLHEVDGIYLTCDDYNDPKDLILSQTSENLKDVTRHIHMVICGEHKGVLGDAILFFDLIFFEGKISDSIERNKAILNAPNIWDHIVEIFNFVTKVLLYINCSNVSILKVAGMDIEAKLRELHNPAKKRKLLQRYVKTSTQAHSYLDISISHDPDAKDSTKKGQHLSGLKSLEKVRAYFRTQRYGTELSQSKIILVQSYLRGEGAEFYKEKKTYRIT